MVVDCRGIAGVAGDTSARAPRHASPWVPRAFAAVLGVLGVVAAHAAPVAATANEVVPVATRFVDQGDGTLRDRQLDVLWTQDDNGRDIKWSHAKAYCAGKGGGWQLPSVDELVSIVDKSAQSSVPCGTYTCYASPLFHLSSAWFWSQEPDGPSRARLVFLVDGYLYSVGANDTVSSRAVCVRH
jgi:Protein of unknown function (DUF1566)